MNTETMIRKLNTIIEKHKNDFVPTFQVNMASMCRDIIPKLEKLAEYEKIGTVDECREAMEKQRAKKPNIWGDGVGDDGETIYDMYDCPNCGESYEIDYDNYKHCPKCGQAIDRRDIDD